VPGRKLPVRRGGHAGVAESLTDTEREIVRLVADGKSNHETAAILGLSPRTVETYRLRLMKKLGIEGLPSLIKYAIRAGITTLD
jgi:DNA-binding CsgD family transcriptional regulator